MAPVSRKAFLLANRDESLSSVLKHKTAMNRTHGWKTCFVRNIVFAHKEIQFILVLSFVFFYLGTTCAKMLLTKKLTASRLLLVTSLHPVWMPSQIDTNKEKQNNLGRGDQRHIVTYLRLLCHITDQNCLKWVSAYSLTWQSIAIQLSANTVNTL